MSLLLESIHSSGLIPKAGPVTIRSSAEMQELPSVSLGHHTDQTYLSLFQKLTWVYIAVSKIARNAAGVPLVAKRERADGKADILHNDPRAKVLRNPFPPYISKRFLMEWTIMSLLLTGKSYWEVWPSIQRPRAIFPLHPEYTVPLPDPQRFISGFKFTNPTTGHETTLDPNTVAWFRFPNPVDDYDGQSPLMAGSLAAATDLTAAKMNLALLFNQGRPSGVLATENPLSTVAFERLQEKFKSQLGPFNSGKPLILEQGLKYEAIGLPPSEMEYLDGRSFTRDELLALYCVPPTVAGVKAANFATAQIEDRKFWEQAIMPTLTVVTEAIDMLMFPDEDVTLCADYGDVMALQEDKAKRELRLKEEFDRGIINRDEYRESIGRTGSVPGGQTFYLLTSAVPLDEEGKPEKPAPVPGIGEQDPGKDPVALPAPDEDDEDKNVDRSSLHALTDHAFKLFTQFEDERRTTIWKELDQRRTRQETLFAREVATLFRGQRERVMTRLTDFAGSHPNEQVRMESVFPLQEEVETFRAAILPAHTRAYQRFFLEAQQRGQGKSVKAGDIDVFIEFRVMAEQARNFLLRKAFTFADFVNRTTMEALRRTLTDGFQNGENITDLQERTQEAFAGTVRANADRALAIARTEIGIVQGVGIHDGYREAGIEEHEWLSSRDSVVRDSHRIDGQVRKLTDRFSNGLLHPGDPDGPVGEIVNCRCSTLAVIPKGGDQ